MLCFLRRPAKSKEVVTPTFSALLPLPQLWRIHGTGEDKEQREQRDIGNHAHFPTADLAEMGAGRDGEKDEKRKASIYM